MHLPRNSLHRVVKDERIFFRGCVAQTDSMSFPVPNVYCVYPRGVEIVNTGKLLSRRSRALFLEPKLGNIRRRSRCWWLCSEHWLIESEGEAPGRQVGAAKCFLLQSTVHLQNRSRIMNPAEADSVRFWQWGGKTLGGGKSRPPPSQLCLREIRARGKKLYPRGIEPLPHPTRRIVARMHDTISP